jgi:hypothetical protein
MTHWPFSQFHPLKIPQHFEHVRPALGEFVREEHAVVGEPHIALYRSLATATTEILMPTLTFSPARERPRFLAFLPQWERMSRGRTCDGIVLSLALIARPDKPLTSVAIPNAFRAPPLHCQAGRQRRIWVPGRWAISRLSRPSTGSILGRTSEEMLSRQPNACRLCRTHMSNVPR